MNFHELFNDSFERCKKDDLFLDRFYKVFLSSSKEVKEKFKNTDMDLQKKILKLSLPFMLSAHQTPQVLSKVAKSHSKNELDIKPYLYKLWIDSMIEAVKQTDIECSPEIETAWRDIMKPGIDYLIDKY